MGPMKTIIVLVLTLLLTACGESGSLDTANAIVPSDAEITYATSAQPDDERLARLYNRSCRNCHAVTGVGAPLTGHEEAWTPRLNERGHAGLLQSTKFGYRFMPAKGLCANCSDDDYTKLIDFMLAPPG